MSRLAALFILLALPARADVVIEDDTYFIIHRDYDHVTNTYSDGPPEGEAEACFQITSARLDEQRIDVELISGTYTPWWMDGESLHPGFKDTYLPAEGFAEKNPEADWTELLRQIWKTVPGCPVPGS